MIRVTLAQKLAFVLVMLMRCVEVFFVKNLTISFDYMLVIEGYLVERVINTF